MYTKHTVPDVRADTEEGNTLSFLMVLTLWQGISLRNEGDGHETFINWD